MNFYMFFKLKSAVKKRVINIGTSNKHIDYMIENDWIDAEINDSTTFDSDPIPFYLGPAVVTVKGIKEYYKVRNSWFKWITTSAIAIASVCATIAGVLIKILS